MLEVIDIRGQKMEKVKNIIIRVTDKLEESCVLGAIRQAMIMMIPLLVVGYMSAMFLDLPIPAYQMFITTLFGGRVAEVLQCVYSTVNDFFSVFLVVATSVSYSIIKRKKQGIYESTGNIIILVIISLAAFAGYSGIQYDDFSITKFSNMYAFSALLVSLVSSEMYYVLKNSGLFRLKKQRTNTDSVYEEAIEGIIPAVIIVGSFSLLHQFFRVCFGVDGLQELMERMFNYILGPLQNGLGAGLIVILLTHGLWFFGIHGHNMLDTVIKQHFADVTAGIFSKTMQDVFVLLGGTGAMLCLVVALLLFAKKKGTRNLAWMAAPTVAFNISEIVLFGIPIILNPIFVVPFMLVPLANFLITYAAIYSGLVPHLVSEVNWTTPIFLSGYQATGSWAGAILQMVCLAVGVCIYMPFVQLYEEQSARKMERDLKLLVQEMQREEENNAIMTLTKREDELGHVARSLAVELVDAIQHQELYLMYQPQVNCEGVCVGVEALIRWNHPELGFIYPPLIIELAKEKHVLYLLEQYIFDTAAATAEKLKPYAGEEFKVSVNITNESLEWDGIEQCIDDTVAKYDIPSEWFCLEITEQDALSTSIDIADKIKNIKAKGHKFLIDDFGMGHTSMAYLQTNYFDVVKLDGSLTRDVLCNERNSDIIGSIVYLSKSLHFKIIAEYVEDENQRDELKRLGCDAFQGYLYSKPLEEDALLTWMKERQNV